ncbi:MAG: hypothetical protein ABIL09_07350 [Gemmatimonadota bacterium]
MLEGERLELTEAARKRFVVADGLGLVAGALFLFAIIGAPVLMAADAIGEVGFLAAWIACAVGIFACYTGSQALIRSTGATWEEYMAMSIIAQRHIGEDR